MQSADRGQDHLGAAPSSQKMDRYHNKKNKMFTTHKSRYWPAPQFHCWSVGP